MAESSTINSLPQELFDMIFDYLDDWKDFMSLSLTSTRLSLAVSQSKKFLSKTSFNLNPGNIKEEIKRKYSQVEIESLNVMVATKKVIQISGNIKQLKLKNITIVNRLDLFNFLKMSIFRQLKFLTLENIQVCDTKSCIPQKFDLQFPNLNSLSILGDVDDKLILTLLNSQKKTLNELAFNVRNLPRKYDDFDNNLKNLDAVKTLILTGDLNPPDLMGDTRFTQFLTHFVYAANIQMTYALLLNFETDMVQFFFSGTKKLTIDFFGGNLGDMMSFPEIEELEIINFRYKQLQILQSFMECNDLKKVKVWVIRGFPKFGDRIFKALHAVVNTAEVFEVFDGKKTHRKTKDEIEMRDFGKILDHDERMEVFEEWSDKKLKGLDRLFEDRDEQKIYKPTLGKDFEATLAIRMAQINREMRHN